jgi:hypothetical protein
MVAAMVKAEDDQLRAMASLIKTSGLDRAMQRDGTGPAGRPLI